MSLRSWLRSLRRPAATAATASDPVWNEANVIEGFRKVCRESNPHAVLAAVGAPPGVDGEDFRHVSYLLAHSLVLPENLIDTCIEAGVAGFEEGARRVA